MSTSFPNAAGPGMRSTGTTGSATGTDEQVHAAYGAADDEAGRVFTAEGGDWDELAAEAVAHSDERIIVNMGPQHPSTHGVLRMVLELDGEYVTECRIAIGYLHTGIEKTMEYRTWVQGTTLCTRMDYLTPLFQELVYCMGVERLLGITDQVPERATIMRVLLCELTRISSHLVAIATGGLELGASTVMEFGFRDRECVLRLIELITGLRMNNAFIRPGGVSQDMPAGFQEAFDAELPKIRRGLGELEALILENPIVKGRMCDVAYLDVTGCMALGITGPILRATGMPYDLRKALPYCGYETYDFDIPTWDSSDAYGRIRVRFGEIHESLRIIEQCLARLHHVHGPVMVTDKHVGWPAQLSIGADGQGNSPAHIKEIMGDSMESLIHHFKLVTEGFRVPPGQVYTRVESAKGELGCHLVADGGTRPYRAHFRDPGFNNLQAAAAMVEGGTVADTVVAVASIDPVLGGVDR